MNATGITGIIKRVKSIDLMSEFSVSDSRDMCSHFDYN